MKGQVVILIAELIFYVWVLAFGGGKSKIARLSLIPITHWFKLTPSQGVEVARAIALIMLIVRPFMFWGEAYR